MVPGLYNGGKKIERKLLAIPWNHKWVASLSTSINVYGKTQQELRYAIISRGDGSRVCVSYAMGQRGIEMESERVGLSGVQVLKWRRVDVMRKLQPIIINQCKFLSRAFEFFFPKKSGTLQINQYKFITTKLNNLME